MNPYDDYSPPTHRNERPRRKSRMGLWIAIVVAVLVLPCGGLLTGVIVLGVYGPETSVYAGNRVPARFIKTMKSVGALDEDEKILYFYSDGFGDILGGFYFVSDKKVAIYSDAVGDSPLTAISFDEIADLELYRDESFLEDSVIELELADGTPIEFPVSSEQDGDQRFFDAIRDRVPVDDADDDAEE